MYRLLVLRHLFSRRSKPAVRWMTRFAFAGFAVAMFSWVTVHGVMSGLQGERLDNLLDEQPHLLWESTPRVYNSEQRENLKRVAGEFAAINTEFILQTEGLVELIRTEERGRMQGSGAVLRADSSVPSGEILLGGELGKMSGLSQGAEVRLRSVWNLEGTPLVARVGGFVYPKNFELAKQMVWVSPTDLESLIEGRGAISRIEIKFQDPQVAPMAREAFDKELSGDWHTWQDLNRTLLFSLALERNMMALAMFFLVVLASLALYLSLSVRVVERTRQSALLLALGAKARTVRNVFLFEGLVIGVVGTVLGVGAALVFCWYVQNHLTFPDMYYSQSIPVAISAKAIAVLVGIALIVATLASYLPARQVSQIEIADGLK